MSGVCEREYFGYSPGDGPMTLARFYNCRLSYLYEASRSENFQWLRLQSNGNQGKFYLWFSCYNSLHVIDAHNLMKGGEQEAVTKGGTRG